MVKHEVICKSVYFEALASGELTFQVLVNDRGYQKGDHIDFIKYDGFETDHHFKTFRDLESKYPRLFREITYVFSDGSTREQMLKPGYVVIGLKVVKPRSSMPNRAKGGKKRMENATAEQRQEPAKKGAEGRWKDKPASTEE